MASDENIWRKLTCTLDEKLLDICHNIKDCLPLYSNHSRHYWPIFHHSIWICWAGRIEMLVPQVCASLWFHHCLAAQSGPKFSTLSDC